MENNWFKDMEKITICIGLAIVYLGIKNIDRESIISPALVTGISLSGLCLTIADFINKQFKASQNKKALDWFIYSFDFSLYFLAAVCILVYPNSAFVRSLDKDTLDWMSTTASVIALGVVFIAIGMNNRKAVLEEENKRFKEIEVMFAQSKKVSEETKDIKEKILVIIEEKDKQIEELEKKINQLEEKKTTTSV